MLSMHQSQNDDRLVRRRCGTVEPSITSKQEIIKRLKKRRRTETSTGGTETILTVNTQKMRIPIVFHIGYTSDNKVGQVDIDEAIRVMNAEFNKQSDNFDSGREFYKGGKYEAVYNDYVSRAGSANIEFYTHQVIYKPLPSITNSDDLAFETKIKTEISPTVDPMRYFNIWIVPDITDGTLGWSSFPSEITPLDGVIMTKSAFGVGITDPFISGNGTLVHETGHYLGLFHIFQGSATGEDWFDPIVIDLNNDGVLSSNESTGDCIADTPPASRPYFQTSYPSTWQVTRVGRKRYYDMFMDQMSYAGDSVRFMFTKDQCTKMRLMITTFRPLLFQYV